MPINLPSPLEQNVLRITQAVRDLASGRSNAAGSGSLTADGVATTTTVTAVGCGKSSHISLSARNANMAAELASGSCYISSVSQGSFVITHRASASARTFTYAIQG